MSQKISTGKIIKSVLLAYVAMVVVNSVAYMGTFFVTISIDEKPILINYLVIIAVAFAIFATIATYFILSILTQVLSKNNPWKRAKNIFFTYCVLSGISLILISSEIITGQLPFVFPWHAAGFVGLLEMVSSPLPGRITIDGLSKVIINFLILISSLSLIYYLLYRKFRKT